MRIKAQYRGINTREFENRHNYFKPLESSPESRHWLLRCVLGLQCKNQTLTWSAHAVDEQRPLYLRLWALL